MKKITAVFLGIALSGFLGSANAADSDEIKKIRREYQAVQNTQNAHKIIIDRDRNYCATGVGHKRVEIILNHRNQAKFIRESFNISAQKFYREYLFDDKNQPVFYYINDNLYDGKKQERIYFLSQGKIQTLPENLQKNDAELQVIKKQFSQYTDLVKALQQSYIKEENIAQRIIKANEAKNHQEIKLIDNRFNEIKKKIQESKEENHLKMQTKVLIHSNNEKSELNFYFLPISENCPEMNDGSRLDLLMIENEADYSLGENYLFNEQGDLKRYDTWEDVEGSEQILYFLNNKKIHCLGTWRVMSDNGSFDYVLAACNDNTIRGIPFFVQENDLTNQEKQGKRYLEIFKKLSPLDLN